MKRAQQPPQPKPEKRIRVRSKSLDQIDETKISLAIWLMAKRLVEEQVELDEQPEQRKAA